MEKKSRINRPYASSLNDYPFSPEFTFRYFSDLLSEAKKGLGTTSSGRYASFLSVAVPSDSVFSSFQFPGFLSPRGGGRLSGIA
jgi:hypothetical protein